MVAYAIRSMRNCRVERAVFRAHFARDRRTEHTHDTVKKVIKKKVSE